MHSRAPIHRPGGTSHTTASRELLVQAGVRGEDGEAAEGTALTGEDPLPEGCGVGLERVVGLGVDDEPGLLGQLIVELARAPARVAGVEPGGHDGRYEEHGVELQVEEPQITEDGDEARLLRRVAHPGEAPAAALLDRSTDVEHRRRRGDVSPLREGPGDVEIRGPVQHQAQRPLGGVLDHEDDGALEVGVSEHRFGDEQSAGGRGHASESRALLPGSAYGHRMLDDGTYDVIVVDATPFDGTAGGLQLEVTVLAGIHKGEVVALLAVGLGVDELSALGTPGTLTVRDGSPDLVLER